MKLYVKILRWVLFIPIGALSSYLITLFIDFLWWYLPRMAQSSSNEYQPAILKWVIDILFFISESILPKMIGLFIAGIIAPSFRVVSIRGLSIIYGIWGLFVIGYEFYTRGTFLIPVQVWIGLLGSIFIIISSVLAYLLAPKVIYSWEDFEDSWPFLKMGSSTKTP